MPAPFDVLAEPTRRRILQLLIRRDIKVRYAGNGLGYLWTVLDPLLMSLMFWFIFTQIFPRSVGYDPYILYPTGDDMDMAKMDRIRTDDLKLRDELTQTRMERRRIKPRSRRIRRRQVEHDKIEPVSRMFDILRGIADHELHARIVERTAMHLRQIFARQAYDFGIQLRYLQHGQGLALVHTIANIDIDMPDITRDLAVHIDILKGLEDASDGKLIRNRADVRCNHGDGWRR